MTWMDASGVGVSRGAIARCVTLATNWVSRARAHDCWAKNKKLKRQTKAL